MSNLQTSDPIRRMIVVALLLNSIVLIGCQRTTPATPLTSTEQRDTTANSDLPRELDGRSAELLSAFFGLDNGLPPQSESFCRGAGGSADELTCPDGMTLIHGGTYHMGDNHSGFVEEKVVEDVSVKDFCIDTYEVSNAQFAEFIAATGYKTVAERPLSLEQFPDLPDQEQASGSLVFIPPEEGVLQVPYLSWWHWIPGAS